MINVLLSILISSNISFALNTAEKSEYSRKLNKTCQSQLRKDAVVPPKFCQCLSRNHIRLASNNKLVGTQKEQLEWVLLTVGNKQSKEQLEKDPFGLMHESSSPYYQIAIQCEQDDDWEITFYE